MAKKRISDGKTVDPQMEGEIVRANINREIVDSSEFVSLYINDTQITVTPWDFRFIFGVIAGSPSDNKHAISVRQTCEVRMSPQHAKRLAMVLIQSLKNYETSIGPIPLPQD